MIKEAMVNLMPGPFVRFFARPYLAGYSLQAGLDTAREFWEQKHLHSTIDLLGEDYDNPQDIQFAFDLYQELIDKLGRTEYATISVKPTLFGTSTDPDQSYPYLEALVKQAAQHNTMIEIDMEDHRYTTMTLEIYKRLKQQYNNVGTVIQTRLHRTKKDLQEYFMNDIKNAKIRLCIGIYNEPSEYAIQDKREMKERILEYGKMLLEHNHFVAFATHDLEYIHKIREMLKENGWGSQNAEFQMLMGVPREKIQQELIQQGYIVRLYVPFAVRKKDGTAYLKRRLKKNPNIIRYGLQNLIQKH